MRYFELALALMLYAGFSRFVVQFVAFNQLEE